MITIILSGQILMMVLSGTAEIAVGEKVEGHMDDIFAGNVLGEEILSAECATESRGVLTKGAVISGNFDCTMVRKPSYVRVGYEGEVYDWLLVPTEEGVKIEKPKEVPTFTHNYPAVVFDRQANERYPAKLQVGSK